MQRTSQMALLIGVIGIAGCEGGPLPGHSHIYQAINLALIEHGACESVPDCEKKELVFWQGGRNRIYFSIYSAADPELVKRVEVSVRKAKREFAVSYPVELEFHKESKADAVRKRLPSKASTIKEIE